MKPLDDIFTQQSSLLGYRFFAADIAVGSYLNYIPMMLNLDLSIYPNVLKYMQEIRDRPAFKKTIANR